MTAARERALPAPAPAVLEVAGLSVVHRIHGRHRTLVSDISMRVHEGECVGIVGESGSGKSLTALSILGLLPRGIHAAGSIRFEGRELLGQGRRLVRATRGSGISLLLQDPSTMLNPLRRCITHVEEGLDTAGRRQRRETAIERLREVSIGEREALRYPFQVSGGMAQRVGLAAALARDPKLLIADEPTTALDVMTQREILELLKTLRERRRMSLVLITHDLAVAFEVCDRVYVMYAGSIMEHAPAKALAREPLHPYTHGLMLSEPHLERRRLRLNVIPGSVPRVDEVAACCAFAQRCRWRAEICELAKPPLRELGEDRASACARLDDVRSGLTASILQDIHEVGRAGMRPTPLLRIQGLEKAFVARKRDEHHVLRGVDLVVGAGEAVGLVGESGSGKTTLARCVVGLETPTGGRIDIDGIDISDYSRLSFGQRVDARRRVQMVFQNPYASLNPALTVGSTLGEAVRAAGGERGDDRLRIKELLEQVGLPASYAGRKPAALSGGERQRVAIARGLAARPRLLVCDEPTSALDVSVQAQILNLLQELQRELALALLFITHDLAVVRQVSDYLYVISDGVLVERGPTAEVLDSPKHDYTQRLLASVPEGRIESA